MDVRFWGFIFAREAAKLGLVRYRLSCHINRGPVLVLWDNA